MRHHLNRSKLFWGRGQYDQSIADLHIKRIAGAKAQPSTQLSGKNNLTFRGDPSTHGKTILPRKWFFASIDPSVHRGPDGLISEPSWIESCKTTLPIVAIRHYIAFRRAAASRPTQTNCQDATGSGTWEYVNLPGGKSLVICRCDDDLDIEESKIIHIELLGKDRVAFI